jgi:predicted transcriptional regulator
MPVQLNVFPFLTNSVIISLHAKLIIIVSTTAKGLYVLKECCNPLNVSCSASSKRNLRPVLHCTKKEVSNNQKGQKICNKCRKTTANLPKI